MKKILSMACVLVLATSCASTPLTQEEQSVRILRKSDADSTCKELGRVTAPGLASISEEGRDSDLKRNTYKLSGDTVAITNRDENNTIFGIAYKCK